MLITLSLCSFTLLNISPPHRAYGLYKVTLKLNFRLACQDFSDRDDLKNDPRLARNSQSRVNPLLNYEALSP